MTGDTLKFRQVGHLSAIDIIDGRTLAYHLQFSISGHHAWHLSQGINRRTRIRHRRTHDSGKHRIAIHTSFGRHCHLHFLQRE